ncbi:hypothetical protein ACPB67_16330 [Micromonospora taraxaci]|uniref:hypothetical protein n=1 Tax=Micromonospora taraxaci TaxID=1316803 RepID=UPI003C2C0CFA
MKAELHARRVMSGDGQWTVRTNERYLRAKPALIDVDHIAGPFESRPNFDRLSTIALRDDIEIREFTQSTLAQINEVKQQALSSGDLVDLFYWRQVLTSCAPAGKLGEVVEEAYNHLTSLPFTDEPGSLVFPNAGVHFLGRSEALMHRTKLIAVLIRLAYDADLRDGKIASLKKQNESGGRVFASSDGLLDGLTLLDAYIGPLLGATTPGVWAFASHRTIGPLFFSLGRSIPGTRSGAAEMLQLLPSRGAVRRTWRAAEYSPHACRDAIAWWSNSLNELFGVLTDFAVFADQNGNYSSTRNHQTLLTTEQLFRRVTSILTSYRDGHAQRVLLFTVLDTLERLTGRSLNDMCHVSLAETTLQTLRERISGGAGEVLIPLAERAVNALREVQNGFFLGVAKNSDGSQSLMGMPLAKAAAEYVKLLRNATHGHGTNKRDRIEITNALLAHHDGDLSHDLPLIGYLYLLDFLSRPSDLRFRLQKRRGSPSATS